MSDQTKAHYFIDAEGVDTVTIRGFETIVTRCKCGTLVHLNPPGPLPCSAEVTCDGDDCAHKIRARWER